MMKKTGKWLFILAFMLICLYPFIGKKIDDKFTLSGVTSESVVTTASVKTIMDGSFQTSLNSWVENNFPGRALLINVRSQLRYSLLNESPNSNVVIGQDKYLFEPAYINCELGLVTVDETTYYPQLINKLETLQAMLNEQGKEMYIFITPNKVHFYKDKIPNYYAFTESEQNNYEMLIPYLQNSDLHYFDSRAYIEQSDQRDFNAPLFYSTGIHWSNSYGYSASKAFSEYISAQGKWDLSEVVLTENEIDKPTWPDADLYQSLNLMKDPTGIQYYSATLSVTEEKDRPNVFLRGGSFMGCSLSGLIRAGVFNKDVHLENNYYFTNRYSAAGTMSSYTNYDGITNIAEMINETDIFILEVNEANISAMTFGFIDYLLEHPEYVMSSME